MRNAVIVIALGLLAAPAHGQPAGAEAEIMFRRGKELMAKGDFAAACKEFEGSQKRDPVTTTLVNLANCREKNQQLATAWGLFLQAERALVGASDPDTLALRKVATDRAATLEPRLSKLTITVGGAAQVAGLAIARDADAVDADGWNRPLPLDGGTYTITARAAGFTAWTTTVTIKHERDAVVVEVPVLQPAAAGSTIAPPDRVAPGPVAAGRSKLPFVLGGAAIALGAGALGFELWGRNIYADAEAELDRTAQLALWDKANTRRYIAQGMGIAAIGCAGVAIVLLVRGGGSEPTTQRASRGLEVVPVAGAQVVGMQLLGSW